MSDHRNQKLLELVKIPDGSVHMLVSSLGSDYSTICGIKEPPKFSSISYETWDGIPIHQLCRECIQGLGLFARMHPEYWEEKPETLTTLAASDIMVTSKEGS